MNKLFDFFLNEHRLILTEGQIQDTIHEVARYLAENPKEAVILKDILLVMYMAARYLAENPKEAGDLAEVMKNEKQ